MACTSSSNITRLTTQLENIDAALILAWDAYNAALEVNEVEDYRFDSAEGSQRAKMRDPEVLYKQISRLERQRKHIAGRLAGTGVVSLNLRRKNYYG